MDDLKDDLINYAISSMIMYIPKMDVTRERISDILWAISRRSSQVYLYSTLIEPRFRFIMLDAFDEESFQFLTNTSSQEYIVDDDIQAPILTHERYKENFERIYIKLYSDLTNGKLSSTLFYIY